MKIRNLLLAATLFTFQTNHPPTVKIESPANNAVLDIKNPIAFQAHVSDPEDGDSRYDEINVKEVILELSPVTSPKSAASRAASAAVRTAKTTPATPPALDPALTLMAGNNCFNCHQFNAKSLGPSFFDIAKRYPLTAANIDTLSRRVRDGSSDIWGRVEKMPSHPELTPAAIRSTVRWILRSAAQPDHAWYSGTTGLLHATHPGTYTLTAAYTDHGTKDQPAQRLTGTDRVTITIK